MSIAPASILAAEIFAPGQIVPLLARLNRGELVGFSHKQGGAVAFTIEKTGHSFVVRDDCQIAFNDDPLFAPNADPSEGGLGLICGGA